VRLPLDVCLVFSANPEDYTARGKIITPLKDRIGSEISTHYPRTLDEGVRITQQEAWVARGDGVAVRVPDFVREVIEQIAFLARDDQRIDKRSGVSQRLPISVLENVVSNAERRALAMGEREAVPRISDIYGAISAITGKLELEYEGEQQGSDRIARDLIKEAAGEVYERTLDHIDAKRIVAWFDAGNTLQTADATAVADLLRAYSRVPDLVDRIRTSGVVPPDDDAVVVALCELLLEGLYAHRRISRSEAFDYAKAASERRERLPRGWSESGGIN
jgi:magnesium chelatase subunit I